MTQDERVFRALEVASHLMGLGFFVPRGVTLVPEGHVHPSLGRPLTEKETEAYQTHWAETELSMKAFERQLTYGARAVLRCADAMAEKEEGGHGA